MGLLRLLLDTHCWLWLKAAPERLPSPLRRRLIRDPSKLVFSSANILEIVIKVATGKLALDGSPQQLVAELVEDGVSLMALDHGHALRMATLPMHHRDPFDRMLVAQALAEDLTLVTADPKILAYDVRAIDARK